MDSNNPDNQASAGTPSTPNSSAPTVARSPLGEMNRHSHNQRLQNARNIIIDRMENGAVGGAVIPSSLSLENISSSGAGTMAGSAPSAASLPSVVMGNNSVGSIQGRHQVNQTNSTSQTTGSSVCHSLSAHQLSSSSSSSSHLMTSPSSDRPNAISSNATITNNGNISNNSPQHQQSYGVLSRVHLTASPSASSGHMASDQVHNINQTDSSLSSVSLLLQMLVTKII